MPSGNPILSNGPEGQWEGRRKALPLLDAQHD